MRFSQSSTEPRKLDTMVAIAIISAKLATMPAMPIAAKLGACAMRVTASSNVGERAPSDDVSMRRASGVKTACASRGCSAIAPISTAMIDR